jgi:hypothetical protein
VIRLNEAKYDRMKFVKAGIKHTDLFFIDGSTPPDVNKHSFNIFQLLVVTFTIEYCARLFENY